MAQQEIDIKEAFAQRLSRYRDHAEKDKFWRARDLNPAKMGRYENQREAPSIEKIVEICEKTGLSPNWLLMGLQPKSLETARRLLPLTEQEVIADVKSDGEATGSTHAKRKTRIKKKGLGPFQAGRVEGGKRKVGN